MIKSKLEKIRSNKEDYLVIFSEDISSLGLANIEEALRANNSLKRLILLPGLKDNDIICLLNSIKNHPKLEKIETNNFKSSLDIYEALGNIISSIPNLKTLELRAYEPKNYDVIEPKYEHFFSQLNESKINYLKICDTDDYTAKLLAKYLPTNKILNSLNMHGDFLKHITDVGAASLAESLVVNKTLKQLNFYLVNIGEQGIKALAKATEHNSVITEINIYHNKNNSPIDEYFIPEFETNFTLTSIGNSSHPEAKKYLQRNKELKPFIKALNQVKAWYIEKRQGLEPHIKPCWKALELMKKHKTDFYKICSKHPELITYKMEGKDQIIELNSLYKVLNQYKFNEYFALKLICKDIENSAADSFGMLPKEMFSEILKDELPLDDTDTKLIESVKVLGDLG
jgi:hypothetical protein